MAKNSNTLFFLSSVFMNVFLLLLFCAERRRKGAIHLAASGGHLDVVEVLIRAGSTLDDVDKFGRSPLMWAAACGYEEVVKLLLQAGASVATQGNWHALHEACKRGFHELAQLLIDAGAPVNNPQHCKLLCIFYFMSSHYCVSLRGPKKTADLSHCQLWFPHEMSPEKQAP